jgi:Holliday junction DNA helicase RuvA
MIAWMKGTVKDRFEDRVILDQNGIGYEIQLPMRIAAHPMGLGEEKEFFIYTYVREDVLALFGFTSWNEREIFLQLIKVSGVGAKTALSILSALEPGVLVSAIVNKDVRTLQSVKGIGKKAAEKIVIELADRMKQFQIMGKVHGATLAEVRSPHEDLISALMNLGYKRPNIESAIAKIDLPDTASFDQMLKESLKMLGK